MRNSKKLVLSGIMIFGILLALVVSSIAWFQANKEVYTRTVEVVAAESDTLAVTIPSQQLQPNAYLGQTGIEYEGYDSPYYLEYFPVSVDPIVEDDRYLKCRISAASIQTAVENEPLQVLTEEDIKQNFTWRLQLVTVDYAEVTQNIYKPSNDFLFCEESAERFLELRSGLNYRLRLYIYFLGEEGYRLLTTTRQNIDASYTFAYSDVSYMWATFNLSIKLSSGSLNTLSFDSRGGSPFEPIKIAGGEPLTLPTPTHSDPRYVFDGWYDNLEYSGTAYNNDTLVTNPKASSFTLYAKWIVNPRVTYHYNGETVNGVPSTSVILTPNTVAENRNLGRVGTKEFYCWTTRAMTYAEATQPGNAQYIYNFSTPVTADLTLYAVWRQLATYTVTFYISQYTSFGTVLRRGTLTVNGVSYTDTYVVTVVEGSTLEQYASLTPVGNLGRTFDMWGTTKGSSSSLAFNFNQTINGNLVAYAYYQ